MDNYVFICCFDEDNVCRASCVLDPDDRLSSNYTPEFFVRLANDKSWRTETLIFPRQFCPDCYGYEKLKLFSRSFTNLPDKD